MQPHPFLLQRSEPVMQVFLGVFLVLLWITVFVFTVGAGCRLTYWSARERDTLHLPVWVAALHSLGFLLLTMLAATVVIATPLVWMGIR